MVISLPEYHRIGIENFLNLNLASVSHDLAYPHLPMNPKRENL